MSLFLTFCNDHHRKTYADHSKRKNNRECVHGHFSCPWVHPSDKAVIMTIQYGPNFSARCETQYTTIYFCRKYIFNLKF
jgi:hypothetical protein